MAQSLEILIYSVVGVAGAVISAVVGAFIQKRLFEKKRSPTPGQFVGDHEKAELPTTPYDITRQLPNLQNLTLILSLADVSDYGATVNRLRNPIINNRDILSVTAIGLYGQNDFLFEVICETDKRDSILNLIKETLEVKEELPKLLAVQEVKGIAKLNGDAIGGFVNGSIRHICLQDGKFPDIGRKLSYKTVDLSEVQDSDDLLAVPHMPVIISYVWIEPRTNPPVVKKAENALLDIYEKILKRDMREVYGLYLLSSAILIKSVFAVDAYYSFTRFTKRIDELLRLSGYPDILRVRTAVGAEIIAWR